MGVGRLSEKEKDNLEKRQTLWRNIDQVPMSYMVFNIELVIMSWPNLQNVSGSIGTTTWRTRSPGDSSANSKTSCVHIWHIHHLDSYLNCLIYDNVAYEKCILYSHDSHCTPKKFGSESCDVTPQAVLKGKRICLPSYYHWSTVVRGTQIDRRRQW